MDRRPERSEAKDYYWKYIDRVQDGDICAALERLGRETVDFLRTISDAQSLHRYAEDKWSIREVVGHVSDSERVFGYRALRFARGDDTPLPGFDENQFMKRARLDDRPYASLVDEFEAVRAASVALLDGLFPEEWTRQGSASGKNVSVRALAWIIAGHELHHVGVLKERYL